MNHDVEIWWLEGVPDASEAERLEWLLPHELEKVERYRHEGARERYVTGRWMLRTLLSERLRRGVADLDFELGEHGKPRLADRALHFNLSHTDSMMVVALSFEHEIGVDVEFIDRNTNLPQVARRSFSDLEYEQFENAADPREAFFSFWTHKEAYLKARGTGIALGLKKFGFILDETYRVIDAHLADVDDDPANWVFERWEMGRHRIAVAFPRSDSRLSLRRFAPVS